jgi:hypothetical protein
MSNKLIEKWSKAERRKRSKKCVNPKGFTMRQFCKNIKTRISKGEKKNESFLYESICKRLLKEVESLNPTDLAMCVQDGGEKRRATLYNPNILLGIYQSNPDADADDIQPAILGSVLISPTSKKYTHGPCNNAFEINYIAGEGHGKDLYGAAYALASPNPLTSDRNRVTHPAQTAWKKAFTSGRKKNVFDDIKNPKTPDPDDDCLLFVDKNGNPIEQLNYSYQQTPEDLNRLATQQQVHDEITSQIVALGNLNINQLELMISKAGVKYFAEHYVEE